MPKLFTIQETIQALSTLPKARIENVKDGLNFYGRKIMKKHFEAGNDKKYNYPKLSPKYAKYKQFPSEEESY